MTIVKNCAYSGLLYSVKINLKYNTGKNLSLSLLFYFSFKPNSSHSYSHDLFNLPLLCSVYSAETPNEQQLSVNINGSINRSDKQIIFSLRSFLLEPGDS